MSINRIRYLTNPDYKAGVDDAQQHFNAQLEFNKELARKRLDAFQRDYDEYRQIRGEQMQDLAFISGVALAGRGALLQAAVGGNPEVENEQVQAQLRELLSSRKDYIDEIGGRHSTLLVRSERIGKATHEMMRDGFGPIVTAYLEGLRNLLNKKDNGEALVAAATRWDEYAPTLARMRDLLAPGAKSGADIKALKQHVIEQVEALQAQNGRSREHNIEAYVTGLQNKTDPTDLDIEVLALVDTSGKDYVGKVKQWFTRDKKKRHINVSSKRLTG